MTDKRSPDWDNPWLQMGLGILGNNYGHYGAFAPALSGGILQGMQNLQTIRQMQQQRAAADLQAQKWAQAQRDEQLRQAGIAKMRGLLAEGKTGPEFYDAMLGTPGMESQAVQGLLGGDDPGQLVQVMRNGRPVYVTRSEALGQEAYVRPGTSLSVNPDGSVSFSDGMTTPLGTKVQNTVEEKAFNAMELMQRLEDIDRTFDPKYLEIPGQVGDTWASIKDKFGLADEAEKQRLAERATWARRAYENLNTTIKEITGAAMTNAEAGRITKQVPDPTKFTGDSPTEFKAKLDDGKRQVRLALIRYQYAARHGLNWRTLSLSGDTLMDLRGAEIEMELRGRGVPDQQIKPLVVQQLKAEFR